ncbi:MAG TPA: DUF3016 domain-containing protein [Lacunisphaera sp.]
MKTKLPLMIVVGLVSVGAALASSKEKPVANVEVTFVAPEKFTDVKDDYMGSDKGRAALLDQLKDCLVTEGAKVVAPDQRLEIKVTDIDLAGDFEPWRGPELQNVRIVKDVYPPRVKLEFRLLSADGKVVTEGKRELQDLGFLMKLAVPTTEPLRYDKQQLVDWLRREFKRSA